VVTYRTHTAIMLVLTLTISNFVSEDGLGVSMGDYSAVFPLLVVACYVSLIAAQKTIFYKTQRDRGDIIAVPEVLCEPRKEGNPQYPTHIGEEDEVFPENVIDTERDMSNTDSDDEAAHPLKGNSNLNSRGSVSSLLDDDALAVSPVRRPPRVHRGTSSLDAGALNAIMRSSPPPSGRSRRRLNSNDSGRISTSSRPSLNRVSSYGHVEAQPSLMDQGKQRRSHSRTHSRNSSLGSTGSRLSSTEDGSEKNSVFAAATADVDLVKLMGIPR